MLKSSKKEEGKMDPKIRKTFDYFPGKTNVSQRLKKNLKLPIERMEITWEEIYQHRCKYFQCSEYNPNILLDENLWGAYWGSRLLPNKRFDLPPTVSYTWSKIDNILMQSWFRWFDFSSFY